MVEFDSLEDCLTELPPVVVDLIAWGKKKQASIHDASTSAMLDEILDEAIGA